MPSGMLCIAIAKAIVRLNVALFIPAAIAIPSGKLCKNMPNIKYIDVLLRLFPFFLGCRSGCKCGITLSRPYITIAPMINPKTHICHDESAMLSGMSSRNDMAIMMPAENAIILFIKDFDGSLIMPIREPIIGPATLMMRMMSTSCIFL